MVGIDRVPAIDATSTIGGSVGRTLRGGFGGVTPIIARGGKTPPADLYGLHPEELLKQPVVTLGEGLNLRADYGVWPVDLAGLRADLLKRLWAKLPRGVEYL